MPDSSGIWEAFQDPAEVYVVADARAVEGRFTVVGDRGVDVLPMVNVRIEAVVGPRWATTRSASTPDESFRLVLRPDLAEDFARELLEAAIHARGE